MRSSVVVCVLCGACVAGPGVTPDTDVSERPDTSGVDSPSDPDPDTGRSDSADTSSAPDTAPVTPEEQVEALGPVTWLRLDELDLGNRDTVGSWVGRVGGAEQPEPTRRPVYRDNTLPVAEVVRFDGVDDQLILTGGPFVAGDASATWLAVVVVSGREGHLAGIGHREPGKLLVDGEALVVREGRLELVVSDGLLEVVTLRGEGPVIADGQKHLVSVLVRPRATAVFLDGAVGPMSASSLPTDQLAKLRRATLGAADGEALGLALAPLGFDLIELVAFPRALDTCERWAAEAYLGARHGIDVKSSIVPPHLRHRAASVAGQVGATIEAWPHETASVTAVGAARPSEPAQEPQVALLPGDRPVVRFDGVDDRLDFSVHVFDAGIPTSVSLAAVLGVTGPSGHVIGGGVVNPGRLTSFGAGVYADGGTLHLKALGLTGGLDVHHPAQVQDGLLHLVEADLTRTRVALAVDGVSAVAVGLPEVPQLSRSSVGAANGSGLGTSTDPLEMDLAEVRVYRYLLDACARGLVREELASDHGIAAP